MRFNAAVGLLALAAVGCGGGGSTGSAGSGGAPYTGPRIYVIQQAATFGSGPANILEFAATASGNTTPLTTITAEATPSVFNNLSSDAAGNIDVEALYGASGSSFRSYAPGTAGVSSGARNVNESASSAIGPIEALTAGPGGEFFAAGQYGGLQAFAASASGVATATRTIYGFLMGGAKLSTLLEPYGLAADAQDNIYVLNRVGVSGGSPVTHPLLVFGPTANGDVAPARAIGGSLTGLTTPAALTLDAAGDIWVTNNNGAGSSILEFGPGANGNVAPIRTIAGSLTQLGYLGGIRVDSSGIIYVVSGSFPNPSIVRFAAGASGNVAPSAVIASPQWTHPDAAASLAVY